MEARERLRLLSREMEMQRSWLAAWLDDAETRAAARRRNVLMQLLLSAARSRSLWFAVFGMGAEWWRLHRRRTRAA